MATYMGSGTCINSALATLSLWFFEGISIFSSLLLVDLLSHLSTELSSTSLLHDQFQLSIAPSSYQRLLVHPVLFIPNSILLPLLPTYPNLLFRAVMVMIHLLTHFPTPVLPDIFSIYPFLCGFCLLFSLWLLPPLYLTFSAALPGCQKAEQ